jgi:predicted PurR-regulated permease PerM
VLETENRMTTSDQDTEPRQPAGSPNPHLWEINWVRDLFWVAVGLLILLFFWWLRAIFQPVLLALLVAYLVNPAICWLEQRWARSRVYVVSVLAAAVALLVIALGIVLVPLAVQQTSELIVKLPDYAKAMGDWLGISDEGLVSKLKDEEGRLSEEAMNGLSYLWTGVVSGVGVLSGVVGTATAFAMGAFLFPVYLFLFSTNWPAIAAWPVKYLPASQRDRCLEIAGKMDHAVGSYFRTRVFIAMIMGAMYSIGWGFAGVPFWLLIGLLGGLLGIIPYAAGLAWFGAMLLCFLELEHGFTGIRDFLHVFLWPSIVYGIVQASDDWCLTPVLQGRELDMGFATIILSVLIGGSVAGILGMLLAVPAAACVRIAWFELVEPRLAEVAEM